MKKNIQTIRTAMRMLDNVIDINFMLWLNQEIQISSIDLLVLE